jgi:hypothetical protein
MGANYKKITGSNSRIIADVIICSSLIMAFVLLVIGVFKPDIDLMKIATAIGVLFGSVAGTALTFLFFQKKTESNEKMINNDKG